MSTIDKNKITSDQLDEAIRLLYYKVENFNNDDLYKMDAQFSELLASPDKITDVQYYYLVNLLNENNKNEKTNNTTYNFNEDIQQDDELQQYTDETNDEVKDLRTKAQQCADNGDYTMMEYYSNLADKIEKK